MAVKKLFEIGSSVIRTRTKEPESHSLAKLRQMISDLTDTMREAGLLGTTAPQIGLGSRVFLTEIRKTKTRKDLRETDPLCVFINPVLMETSKNK